MEIVYPNIGSGKGKINIEYDKIIRFEYYKITSIRAWLQLYNYVTPQCVYITYTDDDDYLHAVRVLLAEKVADTVKD